jgi:hypothetical protein
MGKTKHTGYLGNEITATPGNVAIDSLAGSGTRMVTADASGNLATTAIPSGTFTVVEAEIDFGNIPVSEKSFTITNGAITSGNLIMVSPSGNTATDRVGNDYSWETFSFSATAGTGNFELWANCSNGSLVGKRKILYTYS